MPTASNRTILARIHEALERKGMSARAASLKAGLGADAIRNLERDEAILPRIDTLERLAPVLGYDPAVLAWGAARNTRRKANAPKSVAVIGEVAAGLWHDTEGRDEREYPQHPISFDERYPPEAQYGLVVTGTSINRVAAPGEILHCVDVAIAGLSPSEDDLVIIERRRAQAGQKEVTAKRFHRGRNGKIELRPDSTDKRWSEPVVFDPRQAPDGEEVAVIALVIGIYKPLTRP
jgi:transcriptional regulator with XRE-family HTH domain